MGRKIRAAKVLMSAYAIGVLAFGSRKGLAEPELIWSFN